MYNIKYKFLLSIILMYCVRISGQTNTASMAIFGPMGMREDTTLSFFSPRIYFYAGEIVTSNTDNSQVYFAPTAAAVTASPYSYSQVPVVYTGTADFLFPLGDRSAYHPLWLTDVSTGVLRAAFVAEPHPEQFTAPAPFAINPLFHWTVEGNKTAHLQLQWDVFNYNYPWTTHPQTIRLLGFTGTQWEEIPTTIVKETTETAHSNAVAYRLKTRNKIAFSAFTALSLANDFMGAAVGVSEAITPNGDGINDTWYIESIAQFPQAHLKVFNRWGNQVFNQKIPYRNDWDGTYKNQPLPSAPYFYQIDLDQDGAVDQQGWIYIN